MKKAISGRGSCNPYDVLNLNMNEVRSKSVDKQNKMIEAICRQETQHEIEAYKLLRDPETRAAYHNSIDFANGWLSMARWKSIFWPECYSTKQNAKFWAIVLLMIFLAAEGLTTLVVVFVCGIIFAHLYVWQSENIDPHGCPGIESKVGPVVGQICYFSDGAWVSKMVVKYINKKDKEKLKEVQGSRGLIEIPATAQNIRVSFQVLRFPWVWCDVKKYDRFKQCWVNPFKSHVFTYDGPVIRTFILNGGLYYEAVMKVFDMNYQDVNDM